MKDLAILGILVNYWDREADDGNIHFSFVYMYKSPIVLILHGILLIEFMMFFRMTPKRSPSGSWWQPLTIFRRPAFWVVEDSGLCIAAPGMGSQWLLRYLGQRPFRACVNSLVKWTYLKNTAINTLFLSSVSAWRREKGDRSRRFWCIQ